jgi:hypothetical protein
VLEQEPSSEQIPAGYQVCRSYSRKAGSSRQPRWTIRQTREESKRRHYAKPLRPDRYWQHQGRTRVGRVEKTQEELMQSNRKRDMLLFCQRDELAPGLIEYYVPGEKWTEESAKMYVQMFRSDEVVASDAVAHALDKASMAEGLVEPYLEFLVEQRKKRIQAKAEPSEEEDPEYQEILKRTMESQLRRHFRGNAHQVYDAMMDDLRDTHLLSGKMAWEIHFSHHNQTSSHYGSILASAEPHHAVVSLSKMLQLDVPVSWFARQIANEPGLMERLTREYCTFLDSRRAIIQACMRERFHELLGVSVEDVLEREKLYREALVQSARELNLNGLVANYLS